MENEKPKAYSIYFKRELLQAIREEYPSVRHPEFKLPAINTKINQRAVELDRAINNEEFEIVGRTIVTKKHTFVIPRIPTISYDPQSLREQKVLSVDEHGNFLLKSNRDKVYSTKASPCCDKDDLYKAIRTAREGKAVSALVEPLTFTIVKFNYERSLFDFGQEAESPLGEDY